MDSKRYHLFSVLILLASLMVFGLMDHTSSQEFDKNEISIITSSNQVEPGSDFTAGVRVLPIEPITGVQFDVLLPGNSFYVENVSEGDLFSGSGVTTVFEVKNNVNDPAQDTTYCAILGNSSVSDPGIVALLALKAGNDTGYHEINLSDVIISNVSSNPVEYIVNPVTILVDSKPILSEVQNVQIVEGKKLNMTLMATDSDNDILTFSATSLPEGAVLNSSTGVLTWTPNTAQTGDHYIDLHVSDGYLTDTDQAIITVLSLDITPIAYANGPYEERVGKKVKFSSTGSHDPDGTIMSYTWDFGDGNMGVGSSPFHTYSKTGEYTVTLTVTDDAGNTGTDETTVTVESFFKYYIGKFK